MAGHACGTVHISVYRVRNTKTILGVGYLALGASIWFDEWAEGVLGDRSCAYDAGGDGGWNWRERGWHSMAQLVYSSTDTRSIFPLFVPSMLVLRRRGEGNGMEDD